MKLSPFYILYIYVRLRTKDGIKMGRLTDGSCNIFTKENPYIVQQNPYKVDNTAAWVNMGMQFTTGILGSILNGSKNTDGSDKTPSSVDTKTPEELKSEINAILDKYDSNPGDNNVDANISDLELKLAQQKQELNNKAAQYNINYEEIKTKQSDVQNKSREVQLLDADITTKNNEITNLQTKQKANSEQIKNLKAVQYTTDEKGVKVENKKATSEIEKLTKENEKLKADEEKKTQEKKKLENKKAALNKEIENLNADIKAAGEEQVKELNEIDNKIAVMEVDLKKLDDLKKQLKKAEGKDAIENLTNDETGDITKLIKKLNKAKTPEEKAACQKAVKDALEVYYTKHKAGDNKTIDKLSVIYGARNMLQGADISSNVKLELQAPNKLQLGI